MEYFYLSSEEVRNLLQNAGKIKKDGRCINCNGTGWENWDENGENIKYGRTSNPDRCEGMCEECKGIGFIF